MFGSKAISSMRYFLLPFFCFYDQKLEKCLKKERLGNRFSCPIVDRAYYKCFNG